ncbi:hypothetical protein SD457_10180 [Coprobacillaceae bacterium CR2/5/TPMF4]|nr:hypothetical protein SD457_10180 [Coprobacillaceae bacterium CR2/5/TPMF4]
MQSSDEFSKYTRVGDGFLWYHSDYEEVDKIFDNNGKIIIEGKKFNSCKLIESNIVTTERDLNIDSFFNTYISIYNKKVQTFLNQIIMMKGWKKQDTIVINMMK